MMLSAVCYQNLLICHFCCILCVHPMSINSRCVLDLIMPYLQWFLACILVIYVVTSTSMQSRLRDVADFCDLVISAKSVSVIFCCHVNLLLQVSLCIIWRCSLKMFCYTCHAISIHAPGSIYSLLYLVHFLLQTCLIMLLSAC